MEEIHPGEELSIANAIPLPASSSLNTIAFVPAGQLPKKPFARRELDLLKLEDAGRPRSKALISARDYHNSYQARPDLVPNLLEAPVYHRVYCTMEVAVEEAELLWHIGWGGTTRMESTSAPSTGWQQRLHSWMGIQWESKDGNSKKGPPASPIRSYQICCHVDSIFMALSLIIYCWCWSVCVFSIFYLSLIFSNIELDKLKLFFMCYINQLYWLWWLKIKKKDWAASVNFLKWGQ